MRVHPIRKCIDSDNNDTQEQLYEEEELILDGVWVFQNKFEKMINDMLHAFQCFEDLFFVFSTKFYSAACEIQFRLWIYTSSSLYFKISVFEWGIQQSLLLNSSWFWKNYIRFLHYQHQNNK